MDEIFCSLSALAGICGPVGSSGLGLSPGAGLSLGLSAEVMQLTNSWIILGSSVMKRHPK